MAELHEGDLRADPMAQFGLWFEEARAAQPIGFDAPVLATSVDDVPSARAVIVRGVDERGFVFYTDRESRKGEELTANPRAALVFVWPALERSVRVEGAVELATDAESDAYWQSRPRDSTIAATASLQSTVIESREVLEARVHAVEAEVGDGPIPRPARWGGYRITPTEVEFWQGRPNRLHDRLRYRRAAGGWTIERLSP